MRNVREGCGIVLIVAGLSLKNLQPRVWDPSSPFHIPDLRAVMVSYADFHKMQARRKQAMKVGLRAYLGVPKGALPNKPGTQPAGCGA